jgi:hypothetical protein
MPISVHKSEPPKPEQAGWAGNRAQIGPWKRVADHSGRHEEQERLSEICRRHGHYNQGSGTKLREHCGKRQVEDGKKVHLARIAEATGIV